jgi:hypothetical protein
MGWPNDSEAANDDRDLAGNSAISCSLRAELKTGSFASPSRGGFALTPHIHVLWAQYPREFDFATICLDIAT